MEKALQNQMLFEVGAFSAETGPPGIRALVPLALQAYADLRRRRQFSRD